MDLADGGFARDSPMLTMPMRPDCDFELDLDLDIEDEDDFNSILTQIKKPKKQPIQQEPQLIFDEPAEQPRELSLYL